MGSRLEIERQPSLIDHHTKDLITILKQAEGLPALDPQRELLSDKAAKFALDIIKDTEACGGRLAEVIHDIWKTNPRVYGVGGAFVRGVHLFKQEKLKPRQTNQLI